MKGGGPIVAARRKKKDMASRCISPCSHHLSSLVVTDTSAPHATHLARSPRHAISTSRSDSHYLHYLATTLQASALSWWAMSRYPTLTGLVFLDFFNAGSVLSLEWTASRYIPVTKLRRWNRVPSRSSRSCFCWNQVVCRPYLH